jgi:mycothiol system anti-sigma-R factor
MDCAEFKLMVHAFVDGEFDAREQVEAEQHLDACPRCRELARHTALFRATLQASYTPERAPDALRARIMASLQQQAQAELAAAPVPAPALAPAVAAAPRRRAWAPWAAAAALAALTVGAATLWSGFGPSPAPAAVDVAAPPEAAREAIVAESVNLHRRNLPVEITGPSDARVRYWFHGKVDFPVNLPRFDRVRQENVNLLGARLSNLREKQAAYVVYEARGQKLSVMVFDDQHRVRRVAAAPRARADEREIYNAGGYNVAIVEDDGVTYSITSELPREDMVKLVNAAFQPNAAPQEP